MASGLRDRTPASPGKRLVRPIPHRAVLPSLTKRFQGRRMPHAVDGVSAKHQKILD